MDTENTHETSLPEDHPLRSHLVKRLTVEEAEQREREEDARMAEIFGIDLGYGEQPSPWTEEWESFKASVCPGDELWYFCSPQENWDALCGSEGYVIIRNGEVVLEIETSSN